MLVTAETHSPCKVFDANGLEWHRLKWVDTETGEAEQLIVDERGNIKLNKERAGPTTQIVRLATPVMIMPIRESA